jgi:hypothetical protein
MTSVVIARMAAAVRSCAGSALTAPPRFPPLDVGHSKSGPARSEKEGFCNTQGGGLAVHLVGEAGDADADIPKRLFEPHGVRLPEGRGPNSFAKA